MEIYTADDLLGDGSGASNQRMAALKSATAALYLDRLAKAGASSGTRLLEIGCGSGDLLFDARSRSFEICNSLLYHLKRASRRDQKSASNNDR